MDGMSSVTGQSESGKISEKVSGPVHLLYKASIEGTFSEFVPDSLLPVTYKF
jgi:hypothetical protein